MSDFIEPFAIDSIPDEKPPGDPAKVDSAQRETLLATASAIDTSAIDEKSLTENQRELVSFAKEVATWDQAEQEHFIDKGWREPRADEIPGVKVLVRPSDYDNDLKRGTVNYHEGLWNYSYHSVTVPDGTTIEERNFTQLTPNTPAITGQNLTFVNCNMLNVAIDPSWTVIGCNTAQAWFVDDNGRERREWICAHPIDLTGKEEPPQNVITGRAF